jgi:hypothetical protein
VRTRRLIASLMLLRFAIDTGEPAWSSRAMETLVDAQLAISGGSVCDIFAGAIQVWERHNPPLTTTMVNFVNTITVLCFTRYRRSYRTCDLTFLVDRLADRPTHAGAYLAARALPPQH